MNSIFSFTHDQFCFYIENSLLKGKIHASLLYKEWYRKGTFEGKDKAFDNCPLMLDTIRSKLSFDGVAIKAVNEYDTTKKILFQLPNGLEYEAVLIPMQFGVTLCVSSQVGCKMGCTFCETGRMGLIQNLRTEEIVFQLFAANFILKQPVRNIVFMGMGEPFDNFDNVMQAASIFSDSKGFSIAPSHITISTSGRVDGIYRWLEKKNPVMNLAVSVNAPNDEKRTKIMPINRKYPMQELKLAMQAYNKQFKKEVLVEYVMIRDFNDFQEDAIMLAKYVEGLDVKINLIPYNSQSNQRYLPSTEEKLKQFSRHLNELGIKTLWRLPKGRDIMAACGQLGNVELRKKLSS